MASNLFKKYIWLVDTIRSMGPISFADINERWQRSILSDGKQMALRTFHNHREAIEDLFDIRIACDTRTNCYYVANSDYLRRENIANWLLDNFAICNTLHEAKSLHERILVEDIPSAKGFLTHILEAMRENRQIVVSYQPFYGETPFDLTLRPLFVKLYARRWYLYADKPNDPKIKLYALDRMQEVRLTTVKFTPPADLDPQGYLSAAFGVAVYEDIKPCKILIRAYWEGIKYLRTLPLHASQKEVKTTEEYSDFEYWAAPTCEFYRAVLAHHITIQVLSPLSVRNHLASLLESLNNYYSKPIKSLIFLDFNGVLNTEKYIEKLKEAGESESDQYGYLFDPESVANLAKIIDATGASVVISSEWRLEGIDHMEALWRDRKLPGSLIGITERCWRAEDYLPEVAAELEGTEQLIGTGNEIKMWLLEHAPQNCPYVIIDDEEDILSEQRPHFLKTDPRHGITEEGVNKAIEILNH